MTELAPNPSSEQSPVKAPFVVLTPSHGWRPQVLRDLFEYRGLLYFLAWRDVKVRYKQTLLGATWAIVQPLLTMAIFWVVFGRLIGISTNGLPYPVFALLALVPWTFFSHGLGQASESLTGNTNLISKVYFPRLVLPLAGVLGSLADFFVSSIALVVVLLWFGVTPGPSIVLAPVFLLLVTTTAVGAGLWLAALNAEFRDVRYAVPFLIQIWFFLSPVTYPVTLIPKRWWTLYALNPLAGALEGFRASLTGGVPPVEMVAVSTISAAVLFGSGLLYFRRMERTLADVI